VVPVTSSEGVPYPLPTVHAGIAASEWQIAEAYQLNRISFRGVLAPFSTVGFNSSVVRFFGREIGVEGDLGAGFASPAKNASASSIFLGVGPRIALRGRHHYEPWGHGLVGVQHFSFGGLNFPANSSSVAWAAGGGVDYRFDSGLGVRIQLDYLGSRFGGVFQRNLQVVTGVVWNF
jgi:opacity protein-like surface antigen